MKDNALANLLSELRNLEKEFMLYKESCEKILSSSKCNSLLVDQSNNLALLVESTPVIHSLLGDSCDRLKEFVSASNLSKALTVSLKVSQELIRNFRLKDVNRGSLKRESSYCSLTRESEHLIDSINRQIEKIDLSY